jgi:glycosyltransferase involved in cell wall biosynthesis
MTKHPKVSVITPSYNQGQFIEETILSVFNQTYPNIEYIIIDGKSNDNSVEIIKKYSENLTYWISEKDNGQTDAINKGFAIATGEIVCWINSDDILLPGALQEVVNYFTAFPECKILNGYTLRIDKISNIMFNHFVPKPMKWFAKHGVYYINQPSMFFKKELINKLGFINEKYHARMDQEFVMRVLKNNIQFGKVNKILAAIRIHEDTKTAQNGAIWDVDLDRLQDEYGSVFKVRPDLSGTIIYGLYKLVNLDYLKQFFFKRKWRGKSVEYFTRNSY